MTHAAPLLLIGCGKMGGAMLAGWLNGGQAAGGVHVVEPHAEAMGALAARSDVTVHATADAVPADLAPSVVVLAVKPQSMDEALAPLARFVAPSTCFLSIAAGKTIGYFETHLGAGAAIVRAMPNTPAAVGRGITAYVANAHVTPAQKTHAHGLLESVGEVIEAEREDWLDPVTALSGGGPAYVFLLIETLAAAGEKAGLPADFAMKLARATVSGSGELARQASEPASQLRINVTSPGGTTAEALRVLMDETTGIQPIFDKAIAAATARSKELAG
ncbi:MAG: pyrroline-5-carboxylate reductase [Alphaproteobacteria bacterium]|nr:pyrroline-5-carboxylate reductase [Alphaproteobacteria bacterium]